MENILKIKVYYSDTDAEGVVYYANYLKWMEAGRTELIEQMGIKLKTLREKENIVFPVKEVHCKYFAPAKLYDEVEIHTQIVSTTGATITFEQKVVYPQASQTEKVLCEAAVVLFAMNLKTFRPVKLPKALLNFSL
ncbi:MAG: YbgC/FadM family acyl-CoA thioesterase [Candidatus Margulisiibacteriota bacterium]